MEELLTDRRGRAGVKASQTIRKWWEDEEAAWPPERPRLSVLPAQALCVTGGDRTGALTGMQ